MVNLVDCGRKEFINQTKNRKLYCFGAGKYLQHFIDSNYGIPVEAIIDNFRYMDETPIYIGDKPVKIISADKFEEIYTEDCVVIITCLSIEDVLEQLDSIETFDGMNCYVEMLIEHVTEESEKSFIAMPKEAVIPKKIHYCWFGGNPFPEEYQKYIGSWKKYCPDYEIIQWNESNYDVHKNTYISQAYEKKMWAFVTDYARVDIIYQEGGIYLDTDVELLASLDEFLVWDFFCGYENQKQVNWGAGYGAIRGHKILKQVMEVYENMSFAYDDGTLNLTVCPIIQSEILEKSGFKLNGLFQVKDRIALYPKEYFSPIEPFLCYGNLTSNSHSIHHYSGSWGDSEHKNNTKRYEKRIWSIKEHNISHLKENYAEGNKNAQIKKYQIWDCVPEFENAGSKAPRDIKNIAGKAGYEVINIHPYKGEEGSQERRWSHKRMETEWNNCYTTIPDNSILLLQHPFWQEQKLRNEILQKLRTEKNVKIIVLVHDVEALRKNYLTDYLQRDFNFVLQIADKLIVHNDKMKEYFLTLGIDSEKIISLTIFDYLVEEIKETKKQFKKIVVIAGNLDEKKSPYIGKLNHLKNINIHLYGSNYNNQNQVKNENANIVYQGIVSAGQLPKHFDSGFGLVWDGDSLETCSGNTGQYLLYNNPHKLSLYLAAGLPVIVWSKSATADFVLQNGVGIAVDSLYEIEDILINMPEEEYAQYATAAERMSKQLQQGEYTKKAFQIAEERLKI